MHQKGVAVISSNINYTAKVNGSLPDCKDFTQNKDNVSKAFYKILAQDLGSFDETQNLKPNPPIAPSTPSVKPDGGINKTLDSLEDLINKQDSLYTLESNNNNKQKENTNKRQKDEQNSLDVEKDDDYVQSSLQKTSLSCLNMADYQRLYQNLSLKLMISLDRDLRCSCNLKIKDDDLSFDSLLDDFKALAFTSKIINILDENTKAQLLNQNMPRYVFDQSYMPYIYYLFFKFVALKEKLKKDKQRYSKSLYKEYKKSKDAKKQNNMALLL